MNDDDRLKDHMLGRFAQRQQVSSPLSKAQIDELHKLLAQPRMLTELTPIGPVAREMRRERDRAILDEVGKVRGRLGQLKGASKEAFERANMNEEDLQRQQSLGGHTTQRRVAREPVSKARSQALEQMLSQPRLVLEMTPLGAVTREMRTDRDRSIAQEIQAIRERLGQRQDLCKQAFRRATRKRGRRR